MIKDIFQWITVGHLRRNPPPEVKFLWGSKADGLLQERSFLMVHSSEKQGKSMFMMNLAIAGARADPTFLDVPLREGGFRTLILQCENHLRAMYERFEEMLKNGDLTETQAENIIINGYRAVTLTNPLYWFAFKRKIKEWRPDLVVVDPLAHMLTEDENSNVAVGRGLAPLLKLRDAPGCAVAVVHHDSKVSEATSGRPAHQRSRGANRLTADPDSIISLTPMAAKGSPTAKLSCRPRYGRVMEPFRVRLNPDTFWFERYSVEREYGDTLYAKVQMAGGSMVEVDLIAAANEAWSLDDKAHNHRTVRSRIARAVSDGVLIKVESGGGIVYTVPTKEGV